ncbi:MAG: antibiotic biosynthesis monooxygenase [bacterium]|jgi:heme-degrading monooxygenase HmoA|nr:antibiotic biosynthesis monooxygenase [bacterium]MBK7770115.1 antibiotic biosynthesis monooxygenase [bacterium]
MFIAMNRFRIAPGFEDTFVQMWRERDSRLQDVPGFRQFNLLRGESRPEATIFISHSTWESRQAFLDWTESDAFKQAHAKARAPEGTYLGPPQFEGYEVAL